MFCSNCGAEIIEGHKFCYKCGANQGGSVQTSSVVQTDSHIDKQKRTKIIVASLICLVVVIICLIVGMNLFKKVSLEVETSKLIEQGKKCLDDEDYDEAISFFMDAINITPDSEGAYKGLVDAYRKKGDIRHFGETLREAYEITGSDYFSERHDLYDEDFRRMDIGNAQEIREAVLADIADGIITGNGDLEVVSGNPTTMSETYYGLGDPGWGCKFVAHYDAIQGTCSVSLNGYVLTTDQGMVDYLNAK